MRDLARIARSVLPDPHFLHPLTRALGSRHAPCRVAQPHSTCHFSGGVCGSLHSPFPFLPSQLC